MKAPLICFATKLSNYTKSVRPGEVDVSARNSVIKLLAANGQLEARPYWRFEGILRY